MPILIDILLVLTGFMGAFTLSWLFGLLRNLFWPPLSVTSRFGPSMCCEAVVNELKNAKREVWLVGSRLAAPPISRALVEARSRGVKVEVVLDPQCRHDTDTDVLYLQGQGLTPIFAARTGLQHQTLLIDNRVILHASGPFVTVQEGDLGGSLLIVRGKPELLLAYRDLFGLLRAEVSAPAIAPLAKPETAPTPAPIADEPEPRILPMPSVVAATPEPFQAPAHVQTPAPKPVASIEVAQNDDESQEPATPVVTTRSLPSPLLVENEDFEDEQNEVEDEDSEPTTIPMVTPAAADLFARLRQKLNTPSPSAERDAA
jgi:hypothetical protein